MGYCIVEDGIIINIIVCENDDIAAEFGALPGYEEAAIGQKYSPPPIPAPEPPVTWEAMAQAIREGVNSL